MCAEPGFPWKKAQGVVAEEASSLLPGDWIRRQQHLCHRTEVLWPLALELLTPVNGQVLLGMDTPLLPQPYVVLRPIRVFMARLAQAQDGNNPMVHL